MSERELFITMPMEFDAVETFVGKMYDEVAPLGGQRVVTLWGKDGWPEDFRPGRLIDLEIKVRDMETFRLFGRVVENSGRMLKIDAHVVGERPVRVWST